MILQQVMTPTIWEIEQILWWAGAIIAFSLSFLFLNRMKKSEVSKKFVLGLAIFAFCYGIARIIENIRKYYIAGYDNYQDISNAWISGSQIPGLYFTGINWSLRVVYYIVSWTGISAFYFVSEKYVFKHKYFHMTIASITEGIVSILSYMPSNGPNLVTTILAAIGFFIAGLYPIFLYGKMAIINTGVIKKSCWMVTAGLVLFVFSVMIELPESTYITYLVGGVPLDVWITSIVAPILFFASSIVMTIGFFKMFSSLF